MGDRFICTVELRGGGTAERVVAAQTAQEARNRVEAAGDCFLLDCRSLGRSGIRLRFRKKVREEDLVTFFRQWQMLLRAGIPVSQSIRGMVERKTGAGLELILLSVANDIEGGRSISEAAAAFPETFPLHFIASLSIAERTGTMPEAIGRQIDYLVRMRDLKRTVVAAAAYPALLLISLVGVSVFLLAYVVPSFAQIYSESKANLPWLTVMFMAVSSWLNSHWGWITAAVFGLGAALRFGWKSKMGAHFDRLLLSTPRLGEIVMGQMLARFARTFSTLLKGGYPLLDSLRVSRNAAGNRHLAQRLARVSDQVEGGESLGSALRRDRTFPLVAVRMIEAGEKGGDLPAMLDEIAVYCEEDLRHRIKIATALLEPAMMLLVGLVVAILVIAIYLPIFRIAGVVG